MVATSLSVSDEFLASFFKFFFECAGVGSLFLRSGPAAAGPAGPASAGGPVVFSNGLGSVGGGPAGPANWNNHPIIGLVVYCS